MSDDETFKDVHLTYNTEEMKKWFPKKYPREGASESEIRFHEKQREELSYPASRYTSDLVKKINSSFGNDNAAREREQNKIAGRDFAYAKDDARHASSRSDKRY
jgi:hypothetical protein